MHISLYAPYYSMMPCLSNITSNYYFATITLQTSMPSVLDRTVDCLPRYRFLGLIA